MYVDPARGDNPALTALPLAEAPNTPQSGDPIMQRLYIVSHADALSTYFFLIATLIINPLAVFDEQGLATECIIYSRPVVMSVLQLTTYRINYDLPRGKHTNVTSNDLIRNTRFISQS